MIATRKIACPSCDAKLKIAASFPDGRRITCPKCNLGFPVPAENDFSDSGADVDAGSNHDQDGDAPRPTRHKKLRKKKKAASKLPLIIGLALVGLLVVGGGVTLAVMLLPAKTDRNVAQNSPSNPGPTGPAVAAPSPGAVAPTPPQANSNPGSDSGKAGSFRGPGRGAGPGQPGPSFGARRGEQPSAPPANTAGSGAAAASGTEAGGSQEFAVGKRVFSQNCIRCHSIGDEGSGGGPGRKRDLTGVGADHNVDWFIKFVRDPKSAKPGSRMPPFGDKLAAADLRAVAQYLASLK